VVRRIGARKNRLRLEAAGLQHLHDLRREGLDRRLRDAAEQVFVSAKIALLSS
jgi:hypothetical protein